MEALFKSDYALSFLQGLVDRFNSKVIDEACQITQFDAEDELKRLEMIHLAQDLLDRFQPSDERWQLWAGNVTRVCYDAEDLVDDILAGSSMNSVLEKIWSCFRKGSMARKVQELQDRLEEMIKHKEMVNKTKHLGVVEEHMADEKVLVLPKDLFGRGADKDRVIHLLLQDTNSVISIVGMDGLGKTALAGHVKKDYRIRENFHNIVWVSVNATFDLRKIRKSIPRRMECDYSFLHHDEEIQVLSQDLSLQTNVLIVLDDLWDVKYEEWSSFSTLFLKYSGCKVLLTTRNLNVASVTSDATYHLQRMGDEDCQALIMDRALSSKKLSDDRQLVSLEAVAGAMAQKCKGLPVAANSLGLFLSSKLGDDEWKTLPKQDICDLKLYKEEIFPAFRLSGTDLKSHLKRCLAYCSLFPYEYDFKKDNMAQLWMAEGFLIPQGRKCLEQIGHEYFDELLWRSVFQISDLGNQGMPSYKMHEFIHRFAESVASNICFRLKSDERSSSDSWPKTARHLSFLCDTVNLMFLEEIENCYGLRTLLLLNEPGTKIGKVPYSLFQKLKRLKVLDLSRTDIDELPESLGQLKHLRYLDSSQTDITRLPTSTSDLLGLEVLKLRDCPELLGLPKNLKNMTNLRHLDVDIKGLMCMPQSIGNLRDLKTLPAFIVGKREGYRINELKALNLLHGTICLSDLGNVNSGAEAKEAMICEKPFIKRLELEWSNCRKDGSITMDVLDGFQPHDNLKELQIINYTGSIFPTWLTSSSRLLESIHVQKCSQAVVLPSFGQLPYLKTLHIQGMDRVKYVDHHFCGDGGSRSFPYLESLRIQDMRLLKRWNILPEYSMPRLRELVVENCPNLDSMQSLNHINCLQTLEINNCPKLEALPELPASIESLIIIDSDLVKEQCQPEGGPQWCIIEAISCVEIDGEPVVTRSST